MYAEISTALTSLKSLVEIAKLTSDAKTSAQVIQKTAELNVTILTMQEKMTALHSDKDRLLQEKKELEHKIAQYDHWEAEAARYELKEIASGVFVYTIKTGTATSEPAHWLCTHCYQTNILQRTAMTTEGTFYHCPHCKNEVIDHSNRHPLPSVAVIRRRDDYEF